MICHQFDYRDESSIAKAATIATHDMPLDIVLVTTGILHDGELIPEKSFKEISSKNFYRLFEANTILPTLVAKYFLPKLAIGRRSIFTAMSARLCSISDNRSGGWYAYRSGIKGCAQYGYQDRSN